MRLIEIPDELTAILLESPESGMGYQRGSLTLPDGRAFEGFFIAGSYFVPLESSDLQVTTAERNFSKLLLLDAPEPERLAQAAYGSQPPSIELLSASSAGAPTSLSAQGSLPPHSAKTSATDVFYRVSAFPKDRRVLPDGSLAAGSYSTSQTDITVVPSGLAAVGRYALPTRISARYVFEIRPGVGVTILFGTVTPNYGLAGGGVEVYFPQGTAPNTVKYLSALPEK